MSEHGHHPHQGAIPVGSRVVYHSEHGDWQGVVTDYAEGRDEGDYTIKGFTNDAGAAAGQGDVFARQSVVGAEQGAFTAR